MPVISRRDFLKMAGAAAAGAVLPLRGAARLTPHWPEGPDVRLGRVAWPWGVNVLSRPDPLGVIRRQLYPEEVTVVLREVVGRGMAKHNHVWFEVEDGFIYSPQLQPVRNIHNVPMTNLPPEGVWTEVSVPYIDALARPDPAAPVVYRLYYSSVFKITELHPRPDGTLWYRVYTEIGTRMYAPAYAFRVIQPEEVTPISPNVDPADKRIVVNLSEQWLTAFEGRTEVFRARISSGANYFGEDGVTLTSGTPKGAHAIWSKRYSRHMQGGTLESGYDLPGVAWVCLFAANGAAVHSTYWHNDYGVPRSAGCINCRPDDAKWLFRWTRPDVAYEPGDIIVNWVNRGTVVDIRLQT